MRSLFLKLRNSIERYLPMTFASFILFLFVLYFFSLVVKTTWQNYQSNKSILREEEKVGQMEEEIKMLEYQNTYYKTKSFQEKEAREKLGFIAPGEKIMSVPLDGPNKRTEGQNEAEQEIKLPNYYLWWTYFFGA